MIDWKPLQHVLDSLEGAPFSPDGYQNFIFQWDRAFFEERVEMVGFEGGANTLDAGCGFGQFAAGLAKHNTQVVAIDRAEWMFKTAQVMKQKWNLPNMLVERRTLPDLPYPDASFDFIWCSGVIMFIDRDRCMREFHRLLKPSGRVYVMINSWGRWLYKAASSFGKENRQAAFRDSMSAVNKTPEDGSRCNYLNVRDVGPFCDRTGFRMIGAASDGCLDLKGKGRRLPMFDAELRIQVSDGQDAILENNIEFVAEKI